jgi:hypothetical protein
VLLLLLLLLRVISFSEHEHMVSATTAIVSKLSLWPAARPHHMEQEAVCGLLPLENCVQAAKCQQLACSGQRTPVNVRGFFSFSGTRQLHCSLLASTSSLVGQIAPGVLPV